MILRLQTRIARGLVSLIVVFEAGATHAQWVEFQDATQSHLDLGPISDTDPLEKDIATADLNRDGWEDVIVVRKVRFSVPGAITDILLINQEGVLVNRTADLAPGFLLNPTDARDVFLTDVDRDGWIDVIIANTFGEQPKLYRNRGNDEKGLWLGLADESFRFPMISIDGPLQFCALWADDVTGDGAVDIYFSNYGGAAASQTFDVLLINDGKGFFTDETEARLRGPLGDFSSVAFGTAVEMHDVDSDGDKDIIKISTLLIAPPWDEIGVFLLFNNGNGFFNSHPFQSIAPQDDPYMVTVGDLNGDGKPDFFFQNDTADRYFNTIATTPNGPVTFGEAFVVASQRLNGLGGNTKMVDIDGDGDLDVGVASVDNDIQNCEGLDASVLTLIRNDSGVLSDVYGGVTLPWHKSNFDFALADIDGNGLVDLFQGNCDGYKLFLQFGPFERDCNLNGIADGIDVLSGPLDRWGDTVIDFSSQRESDAHSATRALGEPDTLTFGENENAWSPSVVNGSLEFLTLGFDGPVFATGVTIRETEGNGFVFQIDAVGTDDSLTTVWSGADTSLPGEPADFQVAWPQTDFPVAGLRIHVDTDHDTGREAIDAVQLHGIHVATSEDLNVDGIPDECVCTSPSPAVLPTGFAATNRFLSFDAGNPGLEIAVRVIFISMPESHASLIGTSAWVGDPREVTELAGENDATPPTINASPLVCDPVYLDWGNLGTVHVYNRNIVPEGEYRLQLIKRNCSLVLESNFSGPLLNETSRWGDVAGRRPNGTYTPPDGVVDIGIDVLGSIDKFINAPGALSKVRVDVNPDTPDLKIDIVDVLRLVNAFVGLPFPFEPGPDPILGGPPCEQ